MPNKPLFLNHSNAGLFVVTAVEPMQGQRTVAPGMVMTANRVTLAARKTLPSIQQVPVTLTGRRSTGAEAGELGLEEWLPITVGVECALAFDPSRLSDAGEVVFLGAGAEAVSAWRDCESYASCVTREWQLNPQRVAALIAANPQPHELFFRLVFDYDRAVWNSPEVCRAGGAWLSNQTIPPNERRTVLAHYMSSPVTLDTGALAALAEGILSLARSLGTGNQVSSVGVVFQRLYGFFSDPKTNAWRIVPPGSSADLELTKRILQSPAVGVAPPVRESIERWLAPAVR
jgi:hypothetical protein